MTHHTQWGPFGAQIPIQTPYQISPWQATAPYQAMTTAIGAASPQWGLSYGVVQPHVDLFETSNDVVVACELPAANPNDINLQVNDDSVTISASAFWATGSPGSFYRTISLPTTVRSEQAVANYANGLLEIRMPKSETTRRRLRVNLTR